jgi:hypothetical protein
VSQQLHLFFEHSLVKRRALQVLRYGSVLVQTEGNPTVVTVPRGEEVWSDLPWHRIKSQEWLDDLIRKVRAREMMMRDHGKALAEIDIRIDRQIAELERKREYDRRRFTDRHNADMAANQRLIDELLEQTDSFHVERDPMLDLPPPPGWATDPEDDPNDIPF